MSSQTGGASESGLGIGQTRRSAPVLHLQLCPGGKRIGARRSLASDGTPLANRAAFTPVFAVATGFDILGKSRFWLGPRGDATNPSGPHSRRSIYGSVAIARDSLVRVHARRCCSRGLFSRNRGRRSFSGPTGGPQPPAETHRPLVLEIIMSPMNLKLLKYIDLNSLS